MITSVSRGGTDQLFYQFLSQVVLLGARIFSRFLSAAALKRKFLDLSYLETRGCDKNFVVFVSFDWSTACHKNGFFVVEKFDQVVVFVATDVGPDEKVFLGGRIDAASAFQPEVASRGCLDDRRKVLRVVEQGQHLLHQGLRRWLGRRCRWRLH